ncbi:sulfatase [Haloarcula hispanica]|uniref:Sulfatase n=1 Tax=Haloarcula hispanica TaxID=51589 RepID=A0A482T2V6_HALHI|nr:sulfatase [Haloarcula hispanica]MCJ0618973.1 sulfatase [Haloarcula hispanica]RYJ09506.1 sulfatase [Haloarcula hispanica]
MSPETPNVLCISVDSFRRDFSSVYNSSEDTTPFLKEFGEQSAVYNNAISPSCWTLQVHGSVFTGLYPPEHSVLDEGDVLGNHPTFAEILNEEGYDTQSFGHNGWLEAGGVLRGFDHTSTEPVFNSRGEAVLELLRQTSRGDPFASWILQRDSWTIENFSESVSQTHSPFCHFIHLNGAHWPYSPQSPHYKQFTNKTLLGVNANIIRQRRVYDKRGKMYVGDYKPNTDTLKTIKDLYRGCLRNIDQYIQSIIKILKSEGVYDNTIIVIFGDHGDNFGEDNILGHQFSVADSLIRVPLIIHDPTDRIKNGAYSDIVQLNDLYETIVGLIGADSPDTNSVDIRTETRDTAYTYYSASDSFVNKISENIDRTRLPPKKQFVAWQSPDKKLVYYPDREEYAGPGCNCDKLRDSLMQHQKQLKRIEQQKSETLSDDIKENLEQMGYL